MGIAVTNKISTGIGAIIALIIIIYSLFWFWMAGQIKGEIKAFFIESEQKDIHILTRSLGVTGFPGAHEIHFSGRANLNSIVIEIPMLQIRSTLLPGTALSLEAPQGLSVLEPAITEIWSLDNLRIDTVIPESLPADLTREDLTAWRQVGNKLVLKNIELSKGTLDLKGRGDFKLDHLLQPAGEFEASITGHMEFLHWLQERKHIKTREALLATAILSGLSKTDETLENSYIRINLSLQNQTLFVGPLKLTQLPAINWGWRGERGN